MSWRVSADIGGTFTDLVAIGPAGQLRTRKVSSSVGDYGRAIVEGLGQLFAEVGFQAREVEEVLHATTVASNAILEHKGAKTGLITTQGFRDVLEIRTLRMPRLYDLTWEKPAPLVPRYLRLGVTERVLHTGEVATPLDEAEAVAAIEALLAEGVEAIAVCLLHSYANPAHERRIGELIRARAPKLPVSLSVDVLPEMKEYERTSTTVINAYLGPVLGRYLTGLVEDLKGGGLAAPLLLMQSSGGLMPAPEAARLPVRCVESGPAAGVIGAQALAKRIGMPNVISFDMGGTTAKAGVIEEYQVAQAAEYSVGGGIMVGSRLLSGAGYQVKVPSIDLAEVGAGGGSLIRIDAAGAPVVGPESAGAVPGPVCYGKGNTQPTVTDANVVLGYLNPAGLVGGALPIDAAASRAAIAEKVAAPLGLSPEAAAHGAHLIAASNMIRALKAVSSERGRDPRGFALVAFGGNGPLFAAGMAEALGMRRVVIPPSAGVFSAVGLLASEVEVHLSRSWRRPVAGLDPAALEEAAAALEAEARERLLAQGFAPARIAVQRTATLRYSGQSFELLVPFAAGDSPAALAEGFGAEHERTYGHRAGAAEPVEIVALQAVGRGLPETPRLPETLDLPPGLPPQPPRPAYFGPKQGWLETPVLTRADLAVPRQGPAIIEEYDCTCLVPPGARAALDGFGNIIIELGEASP
ncbi:hydantoinase/oxoprolinase family protein [Siccirubricoccus sp. KC 17139]|uniref:Hydantoinase/oxoprolinase family protein n=1 Tax=Siccirubricoccus soli TaxID=2899147 RepID=A0ABT1D614_9PROT|nr:hydantoinase/oxoprolinase family protein [Siccirubricoccus soli]MCO6417367.1 hydantoinase/oxoprolinase family protein [Siccirubricoccus soli]MCP2683502.1 hydantoinase/oxoprolinase family protein [Siccirubricoccus soli]